MLQKEQVSKHFPFDTKMVKCCLLRSVDSAIVKKEGELICQFGLS